MTEKYKCCLCGKEFTGYGNNPYPLCDRNDYESRCCDSCNDKYVIPTRIALLGKDYQLSSEEIKGFIKHIDKIIEEG